MGKSFKKKRQHMSTLKHWHVASLAQTQSNIVKKFYGWKLNKTSTHEHTQTPTRCFIGTNVIKHYQEVLWVEAFTRWIGQWPMRGKRSLCVAKIHHKLYFYFTFGSLPRSSWRLWFYAAGEGCCFFCTSVLHTDNYAWQRYMTNTQKKGVHPWKKKANWWPKSTRGERTPAHVDAPRWPRRNVAQVLL